MCCPVRIPNILQRCRRTPWAKSCEFGISCVVSNRPNRPASFRTIPLRSISFLVTIYDFVSHRPPLMKQSRNRAKLPSFPSSSTSHTGISMSSKTLEYSSHAPEPLPNPQGSAHAHENENESRYPRLAPHLLLPDGTPDYLRLILNSKVYDLVKETPLVRAVNLSAKLGNEIWLKREDLQEVFSFKIRGAYNFMAHLSEEERWRGVVTCSAGSYVCSVKKISYPRLDSRSLLHRHT